MSKKQKVFVTGGTGFVGGHLLRALIERGDRVVGLCRRNSDRRLTTDLDIEWVIGDLLDPSSYSSHLEGCSQVFHCAADYRLFSRTPQSIYEINVEGTRNLMGECLKWKVPKIIYTSSVAALAVPASARVSDEECRTELSKVVGHYKRSKFLAQEVVLDFAKQGLPVVLVSPSTPVGPGDLKPTATGKIILDFLNGKMPAYMDTGLNLVAVEDVARGHLLAAEKGRLGEIYILGHLNLSLKEILSILAALTNRQAPKIRIPYILAWFVGLLDTFFEGYVLGRQPQVPLEGVKMGRKKMFFTADKARRELGFKPTSVKAALGRAVEWFDRESRKSDRGCDL